MASVQLSNLTKSFAGAGPVLRDLSLDVADGELLVLLGPSGSGKTTTLRLVAGLETPDRGTISLGGRDVTRWSPAARDVAMVFQSHALYPHMTVRGNLAFGLRMRGVGQDEIARRAARVAAMLDIESLLERRPSDLSGGERQRVALGRAIVREPQVFLLDEPLSHLDPALHWQTRAHIARLQRQLGTTMLYVTHDQEEAMTLGHRIAVVQAGQVVQVASPEELYRRPANVFVARFIGAPAMNLFPGRLVGQDGQPLFESAAFRLVLAAGPFDIGESRDVLCGVRPSDIELIAPAPTEATACDAVAFVDVVQPTGANQTVYLRMGERDEPATLAVVPAETALRVSDRVGIRVRRQHVHLFDARTERRIN